MKTNKKILKLASLKKKISAFKKENKQIAFTNGCFDILHAGHVSYLQNAKIKNCVLIIGLNSDVSIKKIKSKDRPIIPENDRAVLLAALQCVDFVILFDEETPENLIRSIKPDVLIKGADWKGKRVAGADIVKQSGGRVRFIKYINNLSTTNIIKEILKKCVK